MSDSGQKNGSPYQGLDARAFWKTGVVEAGGYPPPDLFRPRFSISTEDGIFTAGSCFAQHVGNALKSNGYYVIDAESLPKDTPADVAQKFGYGLFSARFGNIYTVRQLLQLLQEMTGDFTPAAAIWEKDGRYYDAMRPGVEPAGLEKPEHVQRARAAHLAAIRQAIEQTEIFVFTLGLTEAWVHTASGTVYPTAPGTIAGEMDPTQFSFRNFRANEIREDFLAVRDILRSFSPHIRFLLTVSPVPLTATASDQHVLVASTYSKSVLRTVCGELYADFDDIDYFPSFEIVSSHIAGTSYYSGNLRSVKPRGVRRVMRAFMQAMGDEANQAIKAAPPSAEPQSAEYDPDDVICEEQLLEAFAR